MFAIPFGDQADSSTITTIPQSKTAIGRASMALGFPKETFTPIAAGGVPPYGEDMNGILHMLAQAARAAEAGMVRPFAQNYANSINGYPLGAIVAHPSISGRYVMNTQDNNTAAPPGNGWIDPLSDFVTNEAMTASLQQETARAEAAEGSLQSALQSALDTEQRARVAGELPVGSIVLWATVNAPTGWVVCDGRSFTAEECPILSQLFPSLKIPDLRGMFVRGLDTSGKIDPDQRNILSVQKDAMRAVSGKISGIAGVPNAPTGALQAKNLANAYIQGGSGYASYFDLNFDSSQTTPTAAENRPINTALNYIIRFV